MQKGIRRFIDKVFYPPAIEKKESQLSSVYRRIGRKLTGGKISFSKTIGFLFTDYKLEYAEDTLNMENLRRRTEINKNLRVVVANKGYAILVHNGKLLRRMSPMIIRLAKLHNENHNNAEKNIQ